MSDYELLNELGLGEASQGTTKLKKIVDRLFRPQFMQMVVLEVINDPKIITNEKIEYWKKVLKLDLSWTAKYLTAPTDKKVDPLSVQDFPRVLPRNTIIAQKKYDGQSKFVGGVTQLLLPFFPSHISFPCKPGELVWAVYDNPHAKGEKIAYWLCSVVQPYFIEDVNHTHAPMALRSTKLPKAASGDGEELKVPFQMHNGISFAVKGPDNNYKDSKGNVVIGSSTQSQFLSSTDQFIFEKLITTTDASKISSYESVPRFHKRPGDVVLEGSNNSLIVLGTDRLSKIGEFNSESTTSITGEAQPIGLTPNWPAVDFKGGAGSIDLVTGRGYTDSTGGKTVDVVEIKNPDSVLRKEIDKLNLVAEEGNPDLINDRSRILISQKTKVDTKFKLSEYFTSQPEAPADIVDSTNGDAAIVIKSDKIRLVARSDISFIVTNWSPNVDNKTSEIFKQEETNYAKWASITIKSNGDIVFTPSEKGLIKLGGEDADKAILCTDNLSPSKPVTENGKVTFKPGLISTGADLIGTGNANQGTFATKILVK